MGIFIVKADTCLSFPGFFAEQWKSKDLGMKDDYVPLATSQLLKIFPPTRLQKKIPLYLTRQNIRRNQNQAGNHLVSDDDLCPT